jgi:hypothetical protein
MYRGRRRTVLLTALALTLLFGVTGPVIAQEATPDTGGLTILEPDETYGGASRAEWDARWWQWAVSLPPESNPNINFEGADCGAGQFGPVFFIPGNFSPEAVTITCVVPAGTAVYVGLGGAECSSVEPPPFFGRNEEELRACAISVTDTVTDIQFSINGQEIPNVLDYRRTSPLMTLNFPDDNIFGVPGGIALAVADGYSLIIAPPPPGDYEIIGSTTFDGTDTFTSTIQVTVEDAQVIEPEATPGASPEAATPVA